MSFTRTRSAGRSALLLLAVLGCKAEAFGGDDIAIDPASVVLEGPRLPGGTLAISAHWLADAPLPVTMTIDTFEGILATRTPDRPDRFTFQIPDRLTAGSHDLGISVGGSGTSFLAPIRVGGFSDLRYALGSLHGIAQVVTGRPQLAGLIYGAGDCDDQIGLLDLPTARLSRPEGAVVCGHFGLGTSERPGAFTIGLNFDYAWRPAGMLLGKFVVDSTALWGGGLLVHEIGPGVFLDAGEHGIANIWGPSVAWEDQASIRLFVSALHIALTGDGAWAIPAFAYSDSGVLIIDRTRGGHHWSPGWESASTAAGASGEAFVLGHRNGPEWVDAPVWLGSVELATGILTDSTLVLTPSGTPYTAPYGRIYSLQSADYLVLVFPIGGYWDLSFRDPATLAEVARSRSPVAADACELWSDPWLVEDPIAGRFYLTAANCSGRTPILTFELPE